MKLSKRRINQITQLESFREFFASELDRKLQYANLNELAAFVFGNTEKAVMSFLSENEELNESLM